MHRDMFTQALSLSTRDVMIADMSLFSLKLAGRSTACIASIRRYCHGTKVSLAFGVGVTWFGRTFGGPTNLRYPRILGGGAGDGLLRVPWQEKISRLERSYAGTTWNLGGPSTNGRDTTVWPSWRPFDVSISGMLARLCVSTYLYSHPVLRVS